MAKPRSPEALAGDNLRCRIKPRAQSDSSAAASRQILKSNSRLRLAASVSERQHAVAVHRRAVESAEAASVVSRVRR